MAQVTETPSLEGKAFIKLLNAIEDRVSPAHCTYLHFNYWPIIRFMMNANRKNRGAPRKESAEKTQLKVVSPRVRLGFCKAALKSRSIGASRLKDLKTQAQERNLQDHFSHLPQADTLFLTRKGLYKTLPDGRVSERFCDGLRTLIGTQGTQMTLVDADPRKAGEQFFLETEVLNAPPIEKVVELRRPSCFAELWARDRIVKTVERVNAAIPEDHSYLRVDILDVLPRIMVTSQNLMFWRALLQHISPKVIYLTSFTGSPYICAAGKQLGIRVADIQHGGMNRNHPLVANWHKRPKSGYELLPDVFWCWDARSANYINAEKWPAHTAVVGGNPKTALEYTLFGSLPKKSLKDSSERIRPQILVGLQYGSDPLVEEHVKQAYLATRDTVEWRVRLHPLGWGFLDEVVSTFGISQDVVRTESEKPLHQVLPEIDLILCNASTIVHEGIAHGAAAATWSHKGAAIFDELVSSKKISVATDFVTLMNVLLSLTKAPKISHGNSTQDALQMQNIETIKATAASLNFV